MDGFAIRSVDTMGSGSTATLAVVGMIPAGAIDPGSIRKGQTKRIMTGAPMPGGADAVVPLEETSMETPDIVLMPSGWPAGRCVRRAGLDIEPGDVVVEPGTLLRAPQIALCASIGRSCVEVHRRPIVAVLTTGDELIEPGNTLKPGHIYNSNGYGLAAAIQELGAVPHVLETASDDPGTLRSILRSISGADLILTSGGVSVGEFDYVKQIIDADGEVDFWRIRIRPGKPLMLGRLPSGDGSGSFMPILGLPGNPTSTMVTFYVFAQPLILKMMGYNLPVPQPLRAVTRDVLDNRGGRETFFRVSIRNEQGQLTVRLSGGQDSSMLRPLAHANGLARVPADRERVDEGDTVDVYPLGLSDLYQ